ncbi:hypothetical protein R3P38DRAFT_3230731 [Favolaschia claudopus]|uniref:Uncharacterized protein n=1 Tax=Favolaschia claudopus TaxID=2862362 RepID=A0AAV9ZLJ6_9AGAR
MSVLRNPTLSFEEAWSIRMPRFLDTLIGTYCHTFRSLEFQVDQDCLSPLFNGLSFFPRLQSLSLRFDRLDLDAWLWYQGLVLSGPVLQSLTISAELVSYDPLVSNGFTSCFPWKRLTTLDLRHVVLDAHFLYQILHQCSLLQTGKFAVQSSASHTGTQITLPYLTSLYVRFQSRFLARTTTQAFDVKFFNFLAIPSVQLLHISAKVDLECPLSFVEWMSGLSRKLVGLTLETRLPDNTLFEVLGRCPLLQSLTVFLPHGNASQGRPVFQAYREHRLLNLRKLAVVSAAGNYITPKLARFASLDGLIHDLTHTIVAWVKMNPPPGFELHLYADGEVLSGIRDQLEDSPLSAVVKLSRLPVSTEFDKLYKTAMKLIMA